MRELGNLDLCYERLADRFEDLLSQYDTTRRVEVLVDEFLTDGMVNGRDALDVGCGLGYFSSRLHARGACVTACDISPSLLEKTRRRVGCTTIGADVLALDEVIAPASFDLIVSSECIEHTPSPLQALEQMVRVLKPGGWLAVSTPNILWSPIVRLATAARLRPFDGYENFSSWGGVRQALTSLGVRVVKERGLHLIPFQLGWHETSRWLDRHFQWARGGMINICILGQKSELPSPWFQGRNEEELCARHESA